MNAKFKRGVRRFGRKVKKVIRKRYGTWKKLKYSNIIKDVSFLKGIVNAEKRRLNIISPDTLAIAQVNFNASGHICRDITPTPTQSTAVDGRSGSSIKLHSTYFKFQLTQQTSTNHPIKGRVFIVQIMGSPQLTANMPNQFFQGNKWIAQNNAGNPQIFDTNAERNQDYYGQYRVLRTKRFTVYPDSLSGQTQITNVSMGLKYFKGKGHHIRYNADTNTIANGQLLMIVVCDSGNVNTNNASTLAGVSVAGTSTGVKLNYDILHYYFDN